MTEWFIQIGSLLIKYSHRFILKVKVGALVARIPGIVIVPVYNANRMVSRTQDKSPDFVITAEIFYRVAVRT